MGNCFKSSNSNSSTGPKGGNGQGKFIESK